MSNAIHNIFIPFYTLHFATNIARSFKVTLKSIYIYDFQYFSYKKGRAIVNRVCLLSISSNYIVSIIWRFYLLLCILK